MSQADVKVRLSLVLNFTVSLTWMNVYTFGYSNTILAYNIDFINK